MRIVKTLLVLSSLAFLVSFLGGCAHRSDHGKCPHATGGAAKAEGCKCDKMESGQCPQAKEGGCPCMQAKAAGGEAKAPGACPAGCPCGCQEGKPCTCGKTEGTAPAAAPVPVTP